MLIISRVNGWTSLHFAAHSGDAGTVASIVASITANDLPVDAKDLHGRTSLHWAARQGHAEIVPILLAAGSSIEEKDSDGNTPLHLAASSGHMEATSALIAAGASVDAKNSNGRTPEEVATGKAKGFLSARRAALEEEAELLDCLAPARGKARASL